jgi:branched-chain amino acid transport system ATP-binding protein
VSEDQSTPATPSRGRVLEIDGLTLQFGGLTALDDVTFHIEEGEILGLIGPNGAGKTTCFNAVTGIYRPTRGDIRFEGTSIAGHKRFQITQLGVARTFQNIRLFRSMTALENVLVGCDAKHSTGMASALFRLPKHRREEREGHDRAMELLAFMGLQKRADELAANLSYGDQRRVEIARALASDPKLLLLDEPTAGMNPQESQRLTEFMEQLRSERDLTILLIEHDMKVVMGVSEHITVLDHGEKIAEGQPQEIRTNERVIEAYLGKQGGD